MNGDATQGGSPDQTAVAEAEDTARAIAMSDGSIDHPLSLEEEGAPTPFPAQDQGNPIGVPVPVQHEGEDDPLRTNHIDDSLAPKVPQPGDGEETPEPKVEESKSAEDDAASDAEDLSPEEAERRERDMIGLSDTDPDTPESLKKKLSASTEEGKALRMTLNAVLDMLETGGVTVAELGNGKLGLVPVEGYFEELDETDMPVKYENLPEGVRENISKEQYETSILRPTLAALNAARPQATATPEQVRLPVEVVDECFSEMGTAKLKGTDIPRFQDIADPDIQDRMFSLYEDPAFAPFAAAMNTSKAAMKVGLGLLYSRVAYALGPSRAKKADAAAAKAKQEQRNQRDVTPAADAASESATEQPGSENDDIARRIAMADAV